LLRKESKKTSCQKRHLRIRSRINGTAERPRLSIFRSLQHIYAQVINDENGITLASASTMDKELKNKLEYGGNIEAAKIVGDAIAKRSLDKGINKVVFDRGGFIYHGRVAAVAASAREAGLEF
jgi:large subunit ribosomal protein L18